MTEQQTEPTEAEAADPARRPLARLWRRVVDTLPVLLVRAAHPRQAVLTALALAGAATLAGRPQREVLLVGVTVLVGQVLLGWFNDAVDVARDRAHGRDKPVAAGRLDTGTLWFAICCAVLLLIPLTVNNGLLAGACYLVSVLVAALGNLDSGLVRRGLLSWLPWAISFGLYPAFLSYGGWGGQAEGSPPQPAVVALAALLGIGVHFLTALWGLVADNEDGWTYLPLRAASVVGATRLLLLTLLYLAVVTVALAVTAHQVGLTA
ncbi:UbiA family prenyltransferase [Nocardioides sp.]|uniref:UbiA family prenyltransferase n=1 Tax=Nocardioides sp. TaxID=35761 RepID=UPI0039E535E7